MSTNHYTVIPTSFKFRASELNVPFGELDEAITDNATAIAANANAIAAAGTGIELKGYSETEVGPVDASSGTANLDYSAGNIQRVTIGASTDATLTFTNLPTGKSCSATLRLEMAGAVPSSITVQSISVDLTDVTSGGEVLVETLRIGSTWYMGAHHAS